MKCINCGNEIQDGLVTCPFCNANLNNQVPVTPTTPVLPQDQNMVVTKENPVMETNNEPIAQVQPDQTNMEAQVESVVASAPVQQPVEMTPQPTQSEMPEIMPTQEGTPVNNDGGNVETMEPPAQVASIPPMPPVENQSGEKIGSSAPVIHKKTNKKRNMIIIIVVAVLLVLIGIGLFIYFYEFKSADKRIEVLSKNLFGFTKKMKNDSVELSSGKYSINGGITTDKETIDVDFSGTYGVDLKNQILDLTINANSIKVGEELLPDPLNVEFYLNDSKAYVLLQNFYDKYIYTEYPEMKELFDSLSENDINYVVLAKGLENAFSNSIKSANATQTIEDVKINGKTQKANVIRIVSTAANQKLITTNFFRTLANNKAFIKEYAKLTNMTESKAKDKLLKNIENAKYENDPNTKVEIYSPLVGNSLLGARIYGKSEETGEISIMEVYPIAKGYAINLTVGGKSVLKGQFTNSVKKTSKTENTSTSISLTGFSNDTTIKVDLTVNIENDVNPKVEKLNVKNSVDYRYIPLTDQQTIMSKISNYGDIGMYISQYLNSIGFGTNQGMNTSSCPNAFNCVPSGDGMNNTCQVCDDLTQTCLTPTTITCPIG